MITVQWGYNTNDTRQRKGKTMKINGSKVDTARIKFRSKTVTCDPIQYESTATIVINGKTLTGDYCGDSDESRVECNQGAYLSLRANCKRAGIII